MSNVTVQEALKSIELAEETGSVQYLLDALNECKAAIAEIDKCEPVAEAIRERDRLGFAVVGVITKLDEIIDATQEVEIDDFLHIAIPIDMWNELQDALDGMPERADLYTSPQPIEKCEPICYVSNVVLKSIIDKNAGLVPIWYEKDLKITTPLYTSPISKECEPELYMAKNLHNKSYATSHSEAEARLFLLQSGLKVDGIESEVIPLCRCNTSPQPRDWVDVPYEERRELYKSVAKGNIDGFADLLSARLKQINTKG